jgi:hypothetical protein
VQVERYAAAVRGFQLDQHLAPYDLSSWNAWRALSCHISAATLDAVQPVGGNMNVLAEADPSLVRPATAAEQALYAQLQQGREGGASDQAPPAAAAAAADDAAAPGDQQPGEGGAPAAPQQAEQPGPQAARWAAAPHAGRCFYTPLPRLVKRGGLTPQELTGGLCCGLHRRALPKGLPRVPRCCGPICTCALPRASRGRRVVRRASRFIRCPTRSPPRWIPLVLPRTALLLCSPQPGQVAGA